MQWALPATPEAPEASDQTRPIPRRGSEPVPSSLYLPYEDDECTVEQVQNSSSAPHGSPVSPEVHVIDYMTDPNGQRNAAGGHVRTQSERISSSSGIVPFVPALMTHESSSSSFPESFRSSGQSSVTSVARRVMRTGPDLRLIKASKRDLAKRFGSGDGKRKVLGSIGVLKKVQTYEEPNKEFFTSPSSETTFATVPEPTPPPQSKSPHWFRSLIINDSEPQHSTPSPTPTPSMSPIIPVQHSNSESLFRKRDASADDSRSERGEPLGDLSSSSQSLRKSYRPKFPRWSSHSSQLLKRSKPRSPSGTETPPRSGAQTSLDLSEVGHEQLSQEPPKKNPKRSFRPWRWHGPLTSSDAHSISDVINTAELSAINPELKNKKAPPHTEPPSPPAHKPIKLQRFCSAQISTELGKLELPPQHKSTFGPSQADLFTPNAVSGRREGHSYFSMDETSPHLAHRKSYTPDFIGTALGGLSPEPSPPETSGSAIAASSDGDEYFEAHMPSHRHGAARNNTVSPEFVPPGSVRISTPPGFKGKRTGFFFAGHSPDKSPTIDRPRKPGEHRSPSSTGFWDSDAVLMSYSPGIFDEGRNMWEEMPQQQRLAPLTTPDPERDWYRTQLDQVLANEAQKSKDDDASSTGVFSWDVPEHLPGSPLCPLSPKHKGGGKGICVYHGRRKTARRANAG